MSTWQFQTRQFLLPKSGYQLSECEDAIGINTEACRFAIADGATEAFDAQSWAQRLAHSWVQIEGAALAPAEFCAWVAEQGQSLHDSWNGLRLSWYAEEKSRTGSFAAFVGVQLDLEIGAPSWTAIAMGDACLIHCRNEAILKALPISQYQNFNATPLLVSSNPAIQEAALQHIVIASGAIESGDVLLLLSDATAAWYLMLAEQDDRTRSRFDLLLEQVQDCELARLFESERLSGRIKDDDIAVIRIVVDRQ
jgi:hypothetical protein